MKTFIKWVLWLVDTWLKRQEKKAADAAKREADLRVAVERARDAANIDPAGIAGLNRRAKELADKSKGLGICFLFGLFLAPAVYAQDATERIQNYSHEELKVYTQAVVDLAREQKTLIEDLQKQNAELVQRLATVDAALSDIEKSVDKMTARTPRKSAVIWILRVAPVVLAVFR